MSTIGERYPELTELHHEFIRALSEDPKPLGKAAFFWYQGIEFNRSARKPSATSRGHEVLLYLDKTQQKKRVPNQRFAKDTTPEEVCSALISRHAADWDGPYQINFRYDRNSKGIWSGFYSIETSAQHRDIVAGRAAYDDAIAEALRRGWPPDSVERFIDYSTIRKDAGPKVIEVPKSGDYKILDPEPSLRAAWDALVEYLNGRGARYIYEARFKLSKPTARLRDGDNAQVIYCV